MSNEPYYYVFTKNTFYRKSSRGTTPKSLFNKLIDNSNYIQILGQVQINKSKCGKVPRKKPQNGYNVHYSSEFTNNNTCILKKIRTYEVPTFSNANTNNKFIVYAVKEGIIIGYLLGRKLEYPNHIYISSVGVHKNYRGQKVCSTLIEKLIKYMEHNFKEVYVYSLIDATATLISGLKAGDLCYNQTFSKLGYIKDTSFEIFKVFVRITKIGNRNYNTFKKSMIQNEILM
jgi:ribosomal protein S18 acetylase RimI-like enzyme